MKIARIFAVSCIIVVLALLVFYHGGKRGQAEPFGLQYQDLASGTFTQQAVAKPDDTDIYGGKLHAKISAGNVLYYLIGRSVQTLKSDNGGIRTPYLEISQAGWGNSQNDARIGVATSRPTARSGQPLFAQVTLENNSSHPFVLRYGCGPNMELALPQIIGPDGNAVKEKFEIDQDLCYWTGEFDVPAKTIAHYFFNIRDLYEIDRPGRYTMSVQLAQEAGTNSPPHPSISSGVVTFVVLPVNG